MQISRERMTLVSSDANSLMGTCTAFDNDWSLAALVRAIVIKYGVWSIENIASQTEVVKYRVSKSDDLCQPFTGCSAPVTIVEHFNSDVDISCPAGWSAELIFNGKPFPVSQYLSQYTRTKVYINEEEKRVVAYVHRRANHVWIQAFESVLCRLMPWYFPLELSDEEKQFYKSIAVDNKAIKAEDAENVFVNYVNSVAEQIDFREIRLHQQLDGIADRTRQVRIRALKESIKEVNSTIRDLRARLSSCYSQLDADKLELSGFEVLPANRDDAMFNFFKNHKQVTVLDVVDDYLKFGVDDTLEFYDEDDFVRVYRSERSYLSGYDDDIRRALWAIFKERRGIIRIQAVFRLAGFKLVEPVRRDAFVADRMPNPHIYYHACSGGNESYYYQYAESGDWDLGIEQAISATKNINWGDSVVCEEMVEWLRDNDYMPCIYFNDGEPIDGVTNEMKVVSFGEFTKLIASAEGEASNG